MEFWGAEVKGGEPFTVLPEDGMVLHLSQACLGEVKNGKTNEPVYLFIHVNGKKLVLGTLFTEKLPQQQFDLVFDQEFQISHNWKSGSVYFYGYMANNGYEEESAGESDSESSEEEEEEELPVQVQNNGKAKQEKPVEAVKANAAKEKKTDAVKANAGKQKVKIVEPEKDESSDDDLMSDDDDSEDSDDSEDESGESDEETPKKAEPSKKRAAESATKTPVQDKKAKVTPQKTDGKKVSGHVATPHPAKKADKIPKPNQQTPKSGGSSSITCKSCSKGFGSEKALESHSKAKHGDKK